MKKGFTLLETMLGAGLLGVVLLVVVEAFTPGVRVWNLTNTQGQAQAGGMAAHRRMRDELLATTASSIYVLDDPNLWAVSFLSVAQTAGYDPTTGSPIWRQVVAYYKNSGGLWRKSWQNGQSPNLSYILPTTTPFQLSAADLRQLCTTSTGTEQLVDHDASHVSLAQQASGAWRLSLAVQVQTQAGWQTFTRQSDLAPRNGGP